MTTPRRQGGLESVGTTAAAPHRCPLHLCNRGRVWAGGASPPLRPLSPVRRVYLHWTPLMLAARRTEPACLPSHHHAAPVCTHVRVGGLLVQGKAPRMPPPSHPLGSMGVVGAAVVLAAAVGQGASGQPPVLTWVCGPHGRVRHVQGAGVVHHPLGQPCRTHRAATKGVMGTTDAVVHREGGGNRDGQSRDLEPLPPSLVRVCMWCVRAYCACVQSPLQRAPPLPAA